jgi:hypothetical protein
MQELWDTDPRPVQFEVAFGKPSGAEADASCPEHPSLPFGDGENQARVRGRIGPAAVLFQIAFWSLKESGFVGGMKSKKRGIVPLDSDALAQLEEILDAVIPRLAGDIRSGQFPVINSDKTCTRTATSAASARSAPWRNVWKRHGSRSGARREEVRSREREEKKGRSQK